MLAVSSSRSFSALLGALVLAVGVAAPETAAGAAGGRDVLDADGVVYRLVPGYGYQFHPLANFARLNALVSQERPAAARRLAHALVARGIPRGGAIYWEYCFPFGGPSRWTSGFAQAVAAQSLARAGRLLLDRSLSLAADAAFRAITQSHLRPLAGGAWILEYGFSETAILNAQLQSLVSLDSFARLTDAPEVDRTVARLDVASRALLAQFDTGCWSRYSLGGGEADLHYHAYHVQLLRRLAATRPHAIWKRTADRWSRFLRNRSRPCSQRQ
jgi:D-glucuronyl C5-epimerase-like protein